jgi:TPR repeat protein
MNCCLEESADREFADMEEDSLWGPQDSLWGPAEADHDYTLHPLGPRWDIDDDPRRGLPDAEHEGHALAMYDYGLSFDNPQHRVHWLRLVAEEGDARAMYLLAFECDEPSQRRRWLEMAAERGYPPAMCELVLLCDDAGEKRRWLEQAAGSGWLAASLGLAEDQF